MNIEKLIHDLRARINPQYYDQLGTESYERHQVVKALEYLREENERQRFDILAMNQSLDLLREENERLRKDAERGQFLVDRGEWFRHNHDTPHAYALLAIRLPYTADLSCKAMREDAIDAARGAK